MADNLVKSQAFKLKGRLYPLTVVQLLSSNLDALYAEIQETVKKLPKWFDNTPVVLDCTALTDDTLDLQVLCGYLREHHMVPVAIQGGTSFLNTMAQCLSLGTLNGSTDQDKPYAEPVVTHEIITVNAKTKMQTQQVRSGQKIVNSNGDLLVVSSVGQGAEVLAEGNIYIYGALRGRALAGMSGDRTARIFCQSFSPELVSIAGVYRLNEGIESFTGACQVYLDEDRLCIEPVGGS
ncbi:MAG: septum site-determining protein MinC [Legionellaceae bacterium]|nr:septum site-determining protein MinC [Legionellaceae bacterium]